MSQAEDLLSTLSVTSEHSGHSVVDTDTNFKVNSITREITNDNLQKTTLIQGDHNSERFTFEIPRYIEGHDMALCNVVQVYYINIKNSTVHATGVYTVDDLQIKTGKENVLTCSWLISQNATKYEGTLNFMLRLACMTGSKIDYLWNTKVFDKINVVESLDSDASFSIEYLDIIEQWKLALMSDLTLYVDDAIKEQVDVVQISNNKLSIENLIDENTTINSEIRTLESRVNNLSTLSEGSTTGDAELIDIRVGTDGTTYETAGEAVREQFGKVNNVIGENSPFNLFTYVERRYYKGSSSVGLYKEITDSTKLLELDDFLGMTDAGESNLYACVATLTEPIGVFSEGSDYFLIIDSDIEDKVCVRFSSTIHWGTDATSVATKNIEIKKGINAIKLNFVGFSDAGHTTFNTLSIQSNNLPNATKYDVYVVKSSFVVDYMASEIENVKKSLIYNELDMSLNVYTKNVECEATYSDSLLSIHIPEKTTEESEWRFVILSFNLGSDISGKKLLVRRNTNNIRSFGIGIDQYQWSKANFPTDHELHIIDLDDFISNNGLDANTGDYFLIIGMELGNPITYNSERNESVNILEISGSLEDSISPLSRLSTFDPEDYVRTEDLPVVIKNIICWGDSLTAGGGWTTKLAELSGLNVVNCGTGGEGSNTIAARQGADCILINNVTIPADTTPVQLTDYATKFNTYMGSIASPLLQGGSSHVNPCMIGDIEGTLTWTGSSYNDTTGVWTFTRSEEGDEVVINRPTQLTTYADRTYNNGDNIHIFFVGTNDGAFDVDSMIYKIRLMIDRSETKEYLVMGLTRILSDGYKEKFKAAFGRKWLDLHGYLVDYGLEDSGITATEEDTNAITSDLVPPSLLSDAVHYTDKTKELIGVQVYNRMRDLHYFD